MEGLKEGVEDLVRVLGLFEDFLVMEVGIFRFLILYSSCFRSGYPLVYIDISGQVARDLVSGTIGY